MSPSAAGRSAPVVRQRPAVPHWGIVPVILSLAAILAFANSCSGAFVLDDIPAIAENASIRSLTPLSRPLDPPARTTVAGRPVVNLSLALNYAITGAAGEAPSPGAFHAGNIAIHVACALVLFGIVRRTLRSSVAPARYAAASVPIAGAIALLWVVHPLQTAAVTYVIQRAEALMGLFLLLTLYCAIRADDSRSRGWTVGAVAACALGLGSKEVIAVAPLVVLAWDWLFAVRRDGSFHEVWTRRWPLYAGLAATWVLLALIIRAEHRPGAVGFAFEDWPWWRYLATQAGVILHYLRLTVVPSPLVLDYGWPAARSIAEAVPQLIAIALLVIVTVVAFIKRQPAAFAGAVFFLVLAPTSSVVPIVTEVAAEHRMYLPLAAVITLIVIAAFEIGRRGRLPAAAGIAAVAVAALWLGSMTRARNADYASEERIWADTIVKRPDNPRAHINYAVVLLAGGRAGEAEPHLRKAIELSPKDPEAQLALGAALCSTGRCDEGTVHLRRAVELDADNPAAARNLAEALASSGNRREASRYYRRAAELMPTDVFVLNQASWLLATAPEHDVRDGQAALALAERAVQLTGARDPVSLDSLAVAYAELNRFADARAAIDRALEAEQRSPSELGQQLRDHRRLIEAGRPVR